MRYSKNASKCNKKNNGLLKKKLLPFTSVSKKKVCFFNIWGIKKETKKKRNKLDFFKCKDDCTVFYLFVALGVI